MKLVHENQRTIFPCDVCRKILSSSYDLTRHIVSTHMSDFGNKLKQTNIQEFRQGKNEKLKTKRKYLKRKKRKWMKENLRRKRKKRKKNGRKRKKRRQNIIEW